MPNISTKVIVHSVNDLLAIIRLFAKYTGKQEMTKISTQVIAHTVQDLTNYYRLSEINMRRYLMIC